MDAGPNRMADKPVIVLVRPQLGENIGKAARAMLNFGLVEMRLVRSLCTSSPCLFETCGSADPTVSPQPSAGRNVWMFTVISC